MAVVFAAGVAGVVALAPRLSDAFQASPELNGAIVAVFLIGVVYAFRQPWSLRVEIAWLQAFAAGAHADRADPQLLAPMAAMLRGRAGDGRLALSPLALRSLLDGVAARLEERKEITRYLIGLLVFLGLLGTFWGLLDVVGAVARAIAGLDLSGGGDGFVELRDSLSAPIAGMGVAFSSSLFGLAGSLALGLLELLAAQSQNRFYSDLETWLSRRTRIA
ncbi:MAG: flagellar motor protein MotA, partial [Pseudomonadota bacterium]